MLLLVALMACVVHCEVSTELQTVNGALDFTHSSKSLNEYYPTLVTAIELPVLRYTFNWRDQGLEDSLVIPLYDCTSPLCACAGEETALLIELKNWNMTCQLLPFHVRMAEERTLAGSNDDTENEGTLPVLQQNSNELTGAVAASGSSAALAGLKAQNRVITSTTEAPFTTTTTEIPEERAVPVVAAAAAEPVASEAAEPVASEAAEPVASDAAEPVASDAAETVAASPAAAAIITEATTKAAEATTKKTVEATTMKGVDTTMKAVEPTKDSSTSKVKPESDVGVKDDEYTLKVEAAPEAESTPEPTEPIPQPKMDDTSTQESDWRSKYFTILGFFICFIIVMVLIIAFVIIKMKKSREASAMMIATTGNVSPGPALERSFNGGNENEPLTPQVAASHSTFKFGDATTSLTPLPR